MTPNKHDNTDIIAELYHIFSRHQWAQLRADMPLLLSDADIQKLRGINEPISVKEVEDAYLPLSRLLNIYVTNRQKLFSQTSRFISGEVKKVPYIIGLAGSVSVGKSTTARLLQRLLAQWDEHPKVSLVPTDGFLYPNALLEQRGHLNRKGFPESYNIPKIVNFLAQLKSGKKNLKAPVYSHLAYDVVPNQTIPINQPDIVIIEGLNLLQTAASSMSRKRAPVFVSDFFDVSIYIDAHEDVLRKWYIERFLQLRKTAFSNTKSYFHQYAGLSDEISRNVANTIWESINLVNLRENIRPTRGRADIILKKQEDHSLESVALRKL